MLGDGIVIFGTAVVTAPCRNRKSSAKIGSSSRTRDAHRDAGRGERGVPRGAVHAHLDALVGALDPAEPVDEVHVPRRAPELAVRRRLQPDALLHRDDVPDRLVLGGAQCA